MPASTAAKILRLHRRALRTLPALASVAALGAGLGSAAAAAAESTTTTSYASPGVYAFTVPAGISSISVTAIGAAGGASCDAGSGGEGASVSTTIAVFPGESLQVGVGAPGGIAGCEEPIVTGASGAGGGGQGGAGFYGFLSGGGGGGASALALSAPTPGFQAESELVVAGGGGGGGQEGGDGGDAGSPGAPNPDGFGGGGGGAATQAAGGAGGAGFGDCVGNGAPQSGAAGSLGLGGHGADFSGASGGGGGGGGYYGGGGGGGGCRGGGGGGGSSFVAPSATGTAPAAPTPQPSGVTITYASPTAETSSGSLAFSGTQPQGVASAARTLTVENGGAAPLVVSGYTLGGADPDDYLIDNRCQTPVAAGSSCQIAVRFDPQAQGASTATLTLQTTASTAPAPVELSGTGGSPPQGTQGAQGASGEQGAQGPSGAVGAQGLQGVGGAQGTSGLAGARGRRGVAGARGAPSAIRLVSCTATAVGAPGHGPAAGPAVRTACTSRLERAPMSFPTSVAASASLTRSGHLYATGRLAAGQLLLYSRHALVPGSYALTLRWRRGAVTHTAHQQFQVA